MSNLGPEEKKKKKGQSRKVCFCVSARCIHVLDASGHRRGCEVSAQQYDTHQAADATSQQRLREIQEKSEVAFKNGLAEVERHLGNLVILDPSLPTVEGMWGRDDTVKQGKQTTRRGMRREELDFQAKALCILHEEIRAFCSSSKGAISSFLANPLHFQVPSLDFPLLHVEMEFARLYSCLGETRSDSPAIDVLKSRASDDLNTVAVAVASARVRWQAALDCLIHPEPPILSAAVAPSSTSFDCCELIPVCHTLHM